MDFSAFAPHADLARSLLKRPADAARGLPDGAHDHAHLRRVWHNAMTIRATEGGDGRLLAAAVLLHDCVSVEKNSPFRAKASLMASDHAREILAGLGWDGPLVDSVCHAIAAHSFSAGITPRSLEARILQDADRLDAIGMIGVARCFYTAGRMGSALYDVEDPQARNRSLDDRAFAIDHFRTKLLRLADGFQTPTGAAMARARGEALQAFLSAFEAEIGC